MEGFDFTEKYEEAVNEMLEKEIKGINAAKLTDEDKALRIRMIDENRKYFERVLNDKEHNKAIASGETKLSYKREIKILSASNGVLDFLIAVFLLSSLQFFTISFSNKKILKLNNLSICSFLLLKRKSIYKMLTVKPFFNYCI